MNPLNPFRTSLRTLLMALCVTALATACSILPERAPVQIWQPPESTSVQAASAAKFSLRVDMPNINGMLTQNGIVVMPGTGQVSVYKGARWSDSPALLVRNRLVDAFMAAQLPLVTTDDDRFSADYTLSGDLRAFQSEYRSGSPVVVVRYDAQLRRRGSRSILATHSFVVTQNTSGTQVPQIVAAFGAADDALAQQVVTWTLDVASHDHPASGTEPASN